MKKIKLILPILLAFIMLFTFSGCESKEDKGEKSKNETVNSIKENKGDENLNTSDNKENQEEIVVDKNEKNPIATMKVEYVNANEEKKEGTIKIELYPQYAPVSVSNFVNLANNGFYNGLTFHRVIKNFMIQGGDPSGNGTGGATVSDLDKTVQKGSSEDFEYTIKGEFKTNKFDNKIKYEEGTIAMARSDYSYYGFAEEGYNSACSQFFIMNTNDSRINNSLQDDYAAFGKVIEGIEVVRAISETKIKASASGEASEPVNAPKIKSIEVETFGVEYKVPNVINAEEVMQKMMNSSQR